MNMPGRLVRDERGAGAVEFAMAAPVLITMVLGLAQLGIMYSASTGVHHAVEEGARFAAIYPTPSDAEILARVQSSKFMVEDAKSTPVVARGTTVEGDAYVDVSLSYAVPLDFIFFSTPAVTVQHSRRVFRQVDPAPPVPPTSTPGGGTTPPADDPGKGKGKDKPK